MAKNQNIDDLFEEQSKSTSDADDTATKSIVVKANGKFCKGGYLNIFVHPDDLPKFQEFVGKDNYKTFSPASDCQLVEMEDEKYLHDNWTVYLSKPDENGNQYPFGFNDELQFKNTLPHRRRLIAAVRVK